MCFCYIYFWHGLVIQRKNLPDNGAQSCAGSLQKRTFSGSSFSVPGYEGKYADSDRKQHVGKVEAHLTVTLVMTTHGHQMSNKGRHGMVLEQHR